MNDKFWDLNKTKQNSMINGALKVFSRDGFRHASTDEIVAEAGISKGLLFHYFYSKSGIYEFLAEYSARFALVELNSGISKAGPLPYFDCSCFLREREAGAPAKTLKTSSQTQHCTMKSGQKFLQDRFCRIPFQLKMLQRSADFWTWPERTLP